MTERNGSISADKRIEFRIGVNLGDVIVEEHDIFGDGVNVAGQSRRFDGARRCTGVGQTRAQGNVHRRPGVCRLTVAARGWWAALVLGSGSSAGS